MNLNPLASNFSASASPAASSPNASPGSAPEAPKVEKTEFKATLQKIDPASKAKIIREIKIILPQLNLVEVIQKSIFDLLSIFRPKILLKAHQK